MLQYLSVVAEHCRMHSCLDEQAKPDEDVSWQILVLVLEVSNTHTHNNRLVNSSVSQIDP